MQAGRNYFRFCMQQNILIFSFQSGNLNACFRIERFKEGSLHNLYASEEQRPVAVCRQVMQQGGKQLQADNFLTCWINCGQNVICRHVQRSFCADSFFTWQLLPCQISVWQNMNLFLQIFKSHSLHSSFSNLRYVLSEHFAL